MPYPRKLTAPQVGAIRHLLRLDVLGKDGRKLWTQRRLAQRFSVSQPTIHAIAHRETHEGVGEPSTPRPFAGTDPRKRKP